MRSPDWDSLESSLKIEVCVKYIKCGWKGIHSFFDIYKILKNSCRKSSVIDEPFLLIGLYLTKLCNLVDESSVQRVDKCFTSQHHAFDDQFYIFSSHHCLWSWFWIHHHCGVLPGLLVWNKGAVLNACCGLLCRNGVGSRRINIIVNRQSR